MVVSAQQWNALSKLSPGTLGGESKVAQPVAYPAAAKDFGASGWLKRASMASARALPGAVVMGGRLYVVGGLDATGTVVQSSVESWSIDSWTPEVDAPGPLVAPGVGAVGGLIYVVGGSNGITTLDTTWAYGGSWVAKAPVPAAGTYLGTSVNVGVIVCSYLSLSAARVFRYNTLADLWDELHSPGANVVGFGALGNDLYAMSGSGQLRRYNGTIDRWEVRTGLPVAPTSPIALGLAALGSGLIAVDSSHGGVARTYSPATNSWVQIAPMPTPRAFLAATGAGSTAYFVGGVAISPTALPGRLLETYTAG